MRLGGRVVLELAGALVAGVGLALGGAFAWRELAGWREANAAEGNPGVVSVPVVQPPLAAAPAPESPPAPAAAPAPEPPPAPAAARYVPSFHGRPDADLVAPLRAGSPIAKVKFNRGGTSISLRIDFENGARGAFKPEQSNPQTVPRKEIAAYRLDRMMQIGAVPPALAISLKKQDLFARLEPQSRGLAGRIERETRWKKGAARGEISWWIPVIQPARFRGERLDYHAGAILWRRALSVGSQVTNEEKPFLAQISNMILFDFLIDNTDRFSGGNALMSEDGRLLYFMDNALSFHPRERGHEKLQRYLGRVQRVSRRMVEALRGLAREAVAAEMAQGIGGGRLLGDKEIDALFKRRDYMLKYIDNLLGKHGADEVYYFE